MPLEETLEEKLNYLLPGVTASGQIPAWPPDVFCLCAAVLQCSGAYSSLVEDRQTYLGGSSSAERAAKLDTLGSLWRRSAIGDGKIPAEVRRWWKALLTEKALAISQISKSKPCTTALLNLLAVSDEACHGVGIFLPGRNAGITPEEILDDKFADIATELLLDIETVGVGGSTLCREIHPSKGRVLPRMHTPQSGLTVRSLSHHLAYSATSDIQPEWLSVAEDAQDHAFNLLLIPWPDTTDPIQFKQSKKVGITGDVERGGYGLFTYRPSKGPTAAFVQSLISEAERKMGTVNGIIFPELAMSEAEYKKLSRAFVKRDRFLIAGVGREASSQTLCGKNEALLDVAVPFKKKLLKTQFRQKKHHRWKLTKQQIVQYGIGANLHPEASWWEHISLAARSLAFLTLRPWLTLTVLICEDLARPDPVGDLLRSVGPNLVIALLSDGPQLVSRWPGRYAGALADDPGSSVLTVTSAGMSNLSKPIDGSIDKSGVVALWRDPKSGAHELSLEKGAKAIVLNLTVEYGEEWTADGRGDGGFSGYPILAGHHQIYLR